MHLIDRLKAAQAKEPDLLIHHLDEYLKDLGTDTGFVAGKDDMTLGNQSRVISDLRAKIRATPFVPPKASRAPRLQDPDRT